VCVSIRCSRQSVPTQCVGRCLGLGREGRGMYVEGAGGGISAQGERADKRDRQERGVRGVRGVKRKSVICEERGKEEGKGRGIEWRPDSQKKALINDHNDH
jgi:hypothetical protein